MPTIRRQIKIRKSLPKTHQQLNKPAHSEWMHHISQNTLCIISLFYHSDAVTTHQGTQWPKKVIQYKIIKNILINRIKAWQLD